VAVVAFVAALDFRPQLVGWIHHDANQFHIERVEIFVLLQIHDLVPAGPSAHPFIEVHQERMFAEVLIAGDLLACRCD